MLTSTALTPTPKHSTHSPASHHPDLVRISPRPHPSGEGGTAPSLGLIQQNNHPRRLFLFTVATLSHGILALVWGNSTLLQEELCWTDGQASPGSTLGQEAAPQQG